MIGIYRKTLLICLILVSFLIYTPILSSGKQLDLGQFIGLFGLQLIWWQIILGERQINRLFTHDLQWVNKIHKFMGKYGFLVILLHPLIMNLYYGLNPFSLDLEGQFNLGVFLGKVALTILGVIWFVSAVLRNKLPWRWWKRIHLFAYLIFPILLLHSLKVGTDLAEPGLVRFWVGFLGLTYVLAVIIKILDWSGFLKTRYKLISASMVAKDVTRFRLAPLEAPIKPKRGQFAYLQAKNFGEAHPFTISHYDKKSNEISFSIKSVGPYSSGLSQLQPGDTVLIDGPYGVFTREIKTKSKPVVLIAGGIGITPFLRPLAANKADYLYYGARTNEDIAYPNIIANSKVKFYKALSEPQANEKPAFISVGLIDKHLNNLSDYDFYICGPPIMMDKIIDDLKYRKVPKHQIHFEKFSL